MTPSARNLLTGLAGTLFLFIAVERASARKASKAVHDPAATLVVFGGFGHLDGRAQPAFQRLLNSDERARGLYRDLNIAMNEKLGELAAASPGLGRLSAHPIAVTHEDVVGALSERLGRPATALDAEDLEQHFERVLVLALASSLEMEIAFSMVTPVGTKHEIVQILGVSAFLVAAANGDVISMLPLVSQDRRETSEPLTRTLEETLEHYGRAGKSLLERFVARTATRDPSSLFGQWDRYMVTDYRLHSSTGKSFADEPLEKDRCREDDHGCQSLAALLEFGLSEAISNAGHLVLPPVRSSEWGRSAEFRLALTLHSNQAALGTDRLSLRLPETAATHRVTAGLLGVGSFEQQQKKRNRVVTRQVFVAEVRAKATDLGGRQEILAGPIRNSRPQMQIEALRAEDDPAPGRDARRAFHLMAILNALKEAENEMAKR